MYLDHRLEGKRKDLLSPLFLQLHSAVRFGDVFSSRQQLSIEKHRCLMDYDAFPLQVAKKIEESG